MEMASRSNTNKTTMWELFEQTAKDQYGEDIKVVKTIWAQEQLDNLEFDITLEDVDEEPKEARRTIMDINMKEYKNTGEECDESVVRVEKSTSKSKESRYNFSTTTGVDWGVGGNIGAQIMGVAMAGGSFGVKADYHKHKSETAGKSETTGSNFTFGYTQEEKIKVPPMTKIKAKITTYSMKYEQRYTLRLSLPTDLTIPLLYKTKCQALLCGSKSTRISAEQLLYGLRGYRKEDDKVSFLQDGTLS